MTFIFYPDPNDSSRILLYSNPSSSGPALESDSESIPPLPPPMFSHLFSSLFDQLFEQDHFQEVLQNSLETYHEELFKKKDEFQLTIQPIQLQPSDLVSLTDTPCHICLESFLPLDTVYTLPCGHVFHTHCLDDSISFQHDSCPLCRKPLQLVPKWDEYQTEDGHIIRFTTSI